MIVNIPCLFTNMLVAIVRHCMDDIHGMLDCEGITLTYRDSWVYSALNFMTGHEIACDCYQVAVTQFKWGIRMNVL